MTAVVMKLAMALRGMTQNPQATSLMSLPERAASTRHSPTHGATKSAGCSSPARHQTFLHHFGLRSLLAPGSAMSGSLSAPRRRGMSTAHGSEPATGAGRSSGALLASPDCERARMFPLGSLSLASERH